MGRENYFKLLVRLLISVWLELETGCIVQNIITMNRIALILLVFVCILSSVAFANSPAPEETTTTYPFGRKCGTNADGSPQYIDRCGTCNGNNLKCTIGSHASRSSIPLHLSALSATFLSLYVLTRRFI